MGWAPAVFGRFLKPGGRGGRPKLEFALPTMPLVREKARSSSSNFCDDESWGFWLMRLRLSYEDDSATLDDIREAVTTLEDTTRIARRVFGSSNPLTIEIEGDLKKSRAALRAREASTGSA